MDRHADRAATLASLRARWGAAAPRPAAEVFGALAATPLPAEAGVAGVLPGADPAFPVSHPGTRPARPVLVPLPGGVEPSPVSQPLPGEPARHPAQAPARDVDRVIPTGFTELDALLAAGGLPRTGTVAFRGAGSSGATTLALRAVAEAQAGGALVAWVDLSRCLDPVEAAARGVRLEWLAVLVPGSAGEALAMAGSLLQARAVDVLVLDLAGGRAQAAAARTAAAASPVASPAAVRPAARGRRPPRLVDQLARLVAFARRAGTLLLVLEPGDAAAPVRAALDGAGLRLELRRTGWIRLGREVVGQRTEVRVVKDRHGAPDRRTTLRLLYAEGGPRDRCLARDELLAEEPVAPGAARPGAAQRSGPPGPPAAAWSTAAPATLPPSHEPDRSTDAPPPPLLASSRAPARPAARSLDPRRRADRPRRAAVG
jgi:recombination protein RecA